MNSLGQNTELAKSSWFFGPEFAPNPIMTYITMKSHVDPQPEIIIKRQVQKSFQNISFLDIKVLEGIFQRLVLSDATKQKK